MQSYENIIICPKLEDEDSDIKSNLFLGMNYSQTKPHNILTINRLIQQSIL